MGGAQMAMSNDVRKLIYEAVQEGILRKSEIYRRFKISRSGLTTFLKHVILTGRIEPKPFAGGRQPKFHGKDIEKLKKYLDVHPDATLKEILEHFRKDASIMSVYRVLKKMGYHLKKNRYLLASKSEKMLNPKG
jgi:transposase